MSTTPSEQMIDLLKELALLKEMDEKHESGMGSDIHAADLESRNKRRHEICEQIKALGGQLITAGNCEIGAERPELPPCDL
jgi:hypothetical protein